MSQKKRKRRARKPVEEPVAPARNGIWDSTSFWCAITVALVGLIIWMGWTYHAQMTAKETPADAPAATKVPVASHAAKAIGRKIFGRKASSLDALLTMPADQLANVDIAEMNLLCAAGLPGAKGLDIDHALATLDRWADRVRFETERHLYRVNDPRHAEHYRHSEAYLRAEFLLQTLQQDLGVKYDMKTVGNFSFADSRVAFLNGMIPAAGKTTADTPGGTCVSMPVMYVAVGRRLGYPLKLVTTHSHIFVRWDGEDHPNPAWRERFNIEGTNGFSSFDDDYYMTWPHKLTVHQVRANGFLTSLTPREEFALFLAARGHCALDNNQLTFAAHTYENAYRYDPRRPNYRAWFLDAARRSGYRPTTPALASLLANRRRATAARRPILDTPMPSATGMPNLPDQPHAPRIAPQQPRPMTPGIPQPPAADMPPGTLPQPYQPPIPGSPQR